MRGVSRRRVPLPPSSRRLGAVSSFLLLSSTTTHAFIFGGGSAVQSHAVRRRGCCRWRRLSAGEVDDQELDEARLRETLAEVAGIGAGEELGSTKAMDDDLRRELEDNAPSGLQMAQDVMGVNAITYVLGFLVLVSSLANAVLGDGWLGDAVRDRGDTAAASSSSSSSSSRVASFALPPGYAPPPTSELIKTIPDSDLKRFLDGQQ